MGINEPPKRPYGRLPLTQRGQRGSDPRGYGDLWGSVTARSEKATAEGDAAGSREAASDVRRLRVPFAVAVGGAAARKAAKRMLANSSVFRTIFGPLSHWVVRCRVPGGVELSLRPFSNDPWIVREVCGARVYERGPSLQEGMNTLDVGAHIGTAATRASRQVGPRGCVIAFEPTPENRRLLLENLRRNGCRNVTVIPTAVSSHAGSRAFRVSRVGATGGSALESLEKPTAADRAHSEIIEVECVTLDGVVGQFSLPSVDFLKIDVEGHELEVLVGAIDTLRRFHPRIVLETDPRGPLHREVEVFLRDHGYETRSPAGAPWILYGEPRIPT